MKIPKLIILGKEVTKENLLQTKQHLEKYGITINIIDQESFKFLIESKDSFGLDVKTFIKDKDLPNTFSNVSELHINYEGDGTFIVSEYHNAGTYISNLNWERIEVLFELSFYDGFRWKTAAV